MVMSLDLLAGITSDPYATLQEIHQPHFIKPKNPNPWIQKLKYYKLLLYYCNNWNKLTWHIQIPPSTHKVLQKGKTPRSIEIINYKCVRTDSGSLVWECAHLTQAYWHINDIFSKFLCILEADPHNWGTYNEDFLTVNNTALSISARI